MKLIIPPKWAKLHTRYKSYWAHIGFGDWRQYPSSTKAVERTMKAVRSGPIDNPRVKVQNLRTGEVEELSFEHRGEHVG